MKAPKTVNLRFWLPALLSLFFAVWLTFFVYLEQHQNEVELEQSTLEHLNERLAASQRQIENLLHSHQNALVFNEVTSLAFLEGMEEISLLDNNGSVLYSSKKEWQGHNAKEVQPYFNRELFLSSQSTKRQLLRFSEDRRHIFGYQPITLPAKANEIRSSQTGILLFNYDLGAAKANIWEKLLRNSLAIWTIAAILLLLIQWAISQWLSRPLTHLITIIQRFKSGERDVHAKISGNGELATLGNAWNEMHDAMVAALGNLEESQERLSVTLFSIGDAVIATDANGRITLLNGVAQKLTGWQQEMAVGKALQEVFQIVNALTREPVEDPVKRVLATGEIVGLANHTVLISRNRTEYQIADSAAPIKKSTGEIVGVVLVFRDVTDEYALQEKLKKNEELLRLGQAYGEIGTWDADLLTNEQTWSPEVFELLKFPRLEKPTWESFLNLVVADDRQKLIDATNAHIHQGKKYDVEYRIHNANNEIRWMRSVGKAEFATDGTPIRMRGTVQDITDRKQATIQLEIAAP